MTPRILIIDDDPALVAILEASLSFGGFESRSVLNGLDAIEAMRSEAFDAVLLDIGLPDIEGTDLLRRLREFSSSPIIVVSGWASEKDKIRALDLGADDFVPKPFMPGELLARIRAALRRHGHAAQADIPVDQDWPKRAGRLVIDRRDWSVTFADRRIALTKSEFTILQTLAASPFAPVDRAALIRALYGSEDVRNTKIAEVLLGRIRAKLRSLTDGVDLIQNLRGRGWMLRSAD